MGLILIVLLAYAVASAFSSVQELNELTLGRVNNGDTWLVVLYTTWCQFCHDVLPLFDQVAEDASFRVARFDCTGRVQLCASLGFSAWPSIVLIKNMSLWKFEAAHRDRATLAQFGLTGGSGPPHASLEVPSVVSLVWGRVVLEGELVRNDLQTLYEKYDDSVILLALLGLIGGFAVSAVTWRRKQKSD
jgi:thiol-disulfide isomerase/thioredoxin